MDKKLDMTVQKKVLGDINIIDVLNIFLKNFFVLLSLNIIFIFCTITYFSIFYQNSFDLEYKVTPIKKMEEIEYSELNILENLFKLEEYQLDKDSSSQNKYYFSGYSEFVSSPEALETGSILPLTSEKLIEDLFNILNDQEFFLDKFLKSDFANYLINKSNRNYETAKGDISENALKHIIFNKPIIDEEQAYILDKELDAYYSIQISGNQEDFIMIRDSAFEIFNEAQYQLKEDYLNQLAKKNEVDIQILKIRMDTVREKIDMLKGAHRDEIILRILYLKEQANLARELNIEESQINELDDIENIVLYNYDTKEGIESFNYYLRGYKSIEKEIEILSSRDYRNYLSPEIIALDNESKEIESMINSTLYNDIISLTPLKNAELEFRAALLNQHDISYNSSYKKRAYFVMSIILGLLISILVVIFLEFRKKYFDS